MKRWHRAIAAVAVAALLAVSGCSAKQPDAGISAAEFPIAAEPSPQEESKGGGPPGVVWEGVEIAGATTPSSEGRQTYVDAMVQQTIAKFAQPGMSEVDQAKAAFDYMIETTTLLDPLGLELWRIRGEGDPQPSFVENRALSVFQFNLGKCEDYAAALTMLLRGMGMEAEYVPGLTYSTQGALVDHAWTVAKIDGVWYHLDCQLEGNISRHGAIRYKYFMRGDATMYSSHRWGQNLIDAGLLTPAQNAEIARAYIPPACPQDHPAPARHSFVIPEEPDVAAIQAGIEEELQAYELAHGPLEPLELDVIPPVFALEGYGPQD